MRSVAPFSKIKNTIYPDTFRSNAHDVTVSASLYVYDSLIRHDFCYNDLYGGLDKGYKLIINPDSSIKVLPDF